MPYEFCLEEDIQPLHGGGPIRMVEGIQSFSERWCLKGNLILIDKHIATLFTLSARLYDLLNTTFQLLVRNFQ